MACEECAERVALNKTQNRVLGFYEDLIRDLKHRVREQAELINWLKDKNEGFYMSPQWLEIRTRVLDTYGSSCMACGVSPEDGAIIQVDHIKPMSLFPEHALDFNNLQVLCMACNHGKSNRTQKDYRPRRQQDVTR